MQQRLKIAFVCIMSALWPALGGCGFIDPAPLFLPVHAELTMDLSQKGTTAETTFRIWVEDSYRLRLDLPGGREVYKYLGGGFSTPVRSIGASLPVHLSLVRLNGQTEEVIEDCDTAWGGVGVMSWSGSGYGLGAEHFDLKPGKYRLRITNLKEHPQLQYAPAKFWVWYSRVK